LLRVVASNALLQLRGSIHTAKAIDQRFCSLRIARRSEGCLVSCRNREMRIGQRLEQLGMLRMRLRQRSNRIAHRFSGDDRLLLATLTAATPLTLCAGALDTLTIASVSAGIDRLFATLRCIVRKCA